jgi:GntR family transcriptional regulator/MocR family aminotransferase
MDTAALLPVYRQIYLRYRQSIADGRLRPGDRVPSVRALAAELNLARGTVEAAYQLLIGEGYLLTRGPAGTVVAPQLQTSSALAPASALPAEPALFHDGRQPMALQMGLPALDAFPRKLWTRLASRELRLGASTRWCTPTRAGWRRCARRWRAIWASPGASRARPSRCLFARATAPAWN